MKSDIKYLTVLSVLLVIISTPIALDSAFGEPKIPTDKFPVDKANIPSLPANVRIIEYQDITAIAVPLYTTVDDPANHVVGKGGPLDGVGDLIVTLSDGKYRCSGSLLSSGMHVLTAAHCVTDKFGNYNLVSAYITFEGDDGDQTISIDVANSVVHPDYNGDFVRGNDVAVLKLVSSPTSDISTLDIDRNTRDDVGTTADDKTGYGMSGTGDSGATLSSGTKRTGENLYDDVSDTMLKALGLKPGRDFVRGGVLQYDFDNGNSANDAFGYFFGNSDLGLGNNEASSAPGDSGGPSIANGVIIGVTSYGITLTFNGGGTSDVTPGVVDSSYGEFSGDSRVSKYAGFIDEIVGNTGDGGGTEEPAPKCSPGKQKQGKC